MRTSVLIRQLQNMLALKGDIEVRIDIDNHPQVPVQAVRKNESDKFVILRGWEQ